MQPVHKADILVTFLEILRASNSWIPQGLPRSLMGQLISCHDTNKKSAHYVLMTKPEATLRVRVNRKLLSI
jgi:hypothetical protein